MPKQSDDLTREGDEPQETKSGLKIPVPKREKVMGLFEKAAKKETRAKPSRRGSKKR